MLKITIIARSINAPHIDIIPVERSSSSLLFLILCHPSQKKVTIIPLISGTGINVYSSPSGKGGLINHIIKESTPAKRDMINVLKTLL